MTKLDESISDGLSVLILLNDTSYAYNLRRELIQSLIVSGHTVIVACEAKEHQEKLISLGCTFVDVTTPRNQKNPFQDVRLFIRYLNLLRQYQPDVVLTYNIKPNLYGSISCRISLKQYIPNITGLGTALMNRGLLQSFLKCFYKFSINGAACVFFQNSANKNYFFDNRLLKNNVSIRLLPGSGVNLIDFSLKPYPAQSNSLKLLFVSRVMRDKGIQELLEAIAIVKSKHQDIILDIVGGCDEDFESALQTAEQKGQIKYHGQQNDVMSFYQDCHCLVLPTYHEGTANVLLEAAATGRPVIATRVPGCQETFDEGITGLGCDVRSAESLAEAMIKFIELPWEKKRDMGLAGRAKMEREYDRQFVIDAYLEEIERVRSTKE